MSDKDRKKKDGERKDGDAREMHEAVAERKSEQESTQLPKDQSNHLVGDDAPAQGSVEPPIGDDEPLTKRDERL